MGNQIENPKKLEVCVEKHGHHDKLIWTIIAALGTGVVMAMDWKDSVQSQMSDLKSINSAQNEILKQQKDINRRLNDKVFPVYGYSYSTPATSAPVVEFFSPSSVELMTNPEPTSMETR